jgi:hypothetical protein
VVRGRKVLRSSLHPDESFTIHSNRQRVGKCLREWTATPFYLPRQGLVNSPCFPLLFKLRIHKLRKVVPEGLTFFQLIPHKVTTRKRTESKRIQTVRMRDVSLLSDLGTVCIPACETWFCINTQPSRFFHTVQAAPDPLCAAGDLTLFPQGSRFEG